MTSVIAFNILGVINKSGAFDTYTASAIAQAIEEKPSIMARTVNKLPRLTSIGFLSALSVIPKDMQAQEAIDKLRGLFGEPVPSTAMARHAKESGREIATVPYPLWWTKEETVMVDVPAVSIGGNLLTIQTIAGWEVIDKSGRTDKLLYRYNPEYDYSSGKKLREAVPNYNRLALHTFDMTVNFAVFASRWLPSPEENSDDIWGQPYDFATWLMAHGFSNTFRYSTGANDDYDGPLYAPFIGNNAATVNGFINDIKPESLTFLSNNSVVIVDDTDPNLRLDMKWYVTEEGRLYFDVKFGDNSRRYYNYTERLDFHYMLEGEGPFSNEDVPLVWMDDKQRKAIVARLTELRNIVSEYSEKPFQALMENGMEWNGYTVLPRRKSISGYDGRSIEYELKGADGEVLVSGHVMTVVRHMARLTTAAEWKPVNGAISQDLIKLSQSCFNHSSRSYDIDEDKVATLTAQVSEALKGMDDQTLAEYFEIMQDYSDCEAFWSIIGAFPNRAKAVITRTIIKLDGQIRTRDSRKTGLMPSDVATLAYSIPYCDEELEAVYGIIVELLHNHKKNYTSGRYSGRYSARSYLALAALLIENTVKRTKEVGDVESMKRVLYTEELKRRVIFSLNDHETRPLFNAWQPIAEL